MSNGDIDMLDYVAFGGSMNQEEPEEKSLEDLPWQDIRDRVQVLRVIQFGHDKLEAEYFKERANLKSSFRNLVIACTTRYHAMLLCEISVVVVWNVDLCHADSNIYKIVNAVPEAGGGVTNKRPKENALSDFWLRALSNNDVLHAKITEKDKGALRYLRDIKCSRTDNHRGFGFKLEFFFATNPFFHNTVLTKTYDLIDGDLPILRKAIGTDIEWYSGKYLTPNLFKTNNWESFFNFFSPPQVPKVIDENVAKEIENQMEQDYEIGSTIRELIPHVVSWNLALPPSDVPLPGNSHIRMSDLAFGGTLNEEDQVVLVNAFNRKLDKLEKQFLMQRGALKAKYEKLYEPFYNQQCNSVSASVEVCEANKVAGVNGVPRFWLDALFNNNVLAAEITGHDLQALAYLRDIKCSKIDDDNRGFKLDFYFERNHFFKNSVLTKTYHMVDEDVPILAKAIGTEIAWYPDCCLTNKNPIEKKSKKGSCSTRTENRKSFFNFFSEHHVHEDIDTVRNKMEVDYEIGATVRETIIPYAVSWYTGEAWRSRVEYIDIDIDDDEDGGDQNDDDDGDSDDGDDE
ncbi:hypothetical protein M0R45_009751 [Rubus argutus]|uniref:Nucleosome assembly protein n=1 Tax=Rubus argutus TaxID=59490 RepID=A0AAW1Y8F1_RUBAR